MKTFKTIIRKSFEVSTEETGSHLAPDSYTKYNERLNMYFAGKLSFESVYGYEQALEHIQERKAHIYNDELINKDKKFYIRTVTEVITIIEAD